MSITLIATDPVKVIELKYVQPVIKWRVPTCFT